MSRRPVLVDVFCGGGGASVGYSRAGFDVVGVDIHPQKNYPFRFIQAHALEFLRVHGHEFDAIHASPPCQAHSVAQHIHGNGDDHPDLIDATRELLIASGKPWVMENVPGSPLRSPIMLCGLMFRLQVIRHRLFESNVEIFPPAHHKHPKGLTTGVLKASRGGAGNGYSTGKHGLVCVAGNNFVLAAGMKAMGIDWPMTRKECANAIPPSYTLHVGTALIAHLRK